MMCPKCGNEMKFLWDGNPDGNVAEECPSCGCYQLNNDPPFVNYNEAVKAHEALEKAIILLGGVS